MKLLQYVLLFEQYYCYVVFVGGSSRRTSSHYGTESCYYSRAAKSTSRQMCKTGAAVS